MKCKQTAIFLSASNWCRESYSVLYFLPSICMCVCVCAVAWRSSSLKFSRSFFHLIFIHLICAPNILCVLMPIQNPKSTRFNAVCLSHGCQSMCNILQAFDVNVRDSLFRSSVFISFLLSLLALFLSLEIQSNAKKSICHIYMYKSINNIGKLLKEE